MRLLDAFNNSVNDPKIQGNPKSEEVKDELESYDVYDDITDKQIDFSDLLYALRHIGKDMSFDGLPGDGLSLIPYNLKICIL